MDNSVASRTDGQADSPEVDEIENKALQPYHAWRTWKNLLVLTLSYTLVFTAYGSLQNLQSSLNDVAGLGVVALACVYGGSTLSCAYAPFWLSKIGYKTTIMVSFVVHSLFVAANFYPQWYTLVPVGSLVGFITGPLWTVQGSFVTVLACRHAAGKSASVLATVSSFSGIFFFIYQTSFIWGNLAASLVLGKYYDAHNTTSGNTTNGSQPNSTDCGAAYCPYNDNSQLGEPPKFLVYIMLAILMGFVLIGILLVIFLLDDVTPHASPEEKERAAKSPTMDAIRLMVSPRMLPLLPLLAMIGLEQAFMYGDFTQAFISCSLGISMVGFSIACLGVFTSSFAMIFGKLERTVGIVTFFTYALCVNLALCISMLLWKPEADKVYVFFIMTGAWGTADGIYQAGSVAILGYQFEDQKEPAFAVYQFMASLVSVASFGYSNYLCMFVKTWITIGIAAISLLGVWYHYCRYRTEYSHKLEEDEVTIVKNIQ